MATDRSRGRPAATRRCRSRALDAARHRLRRRVRRDHAVRRELRQVGDRLHHAQPDPLRSTPADERGTAGNLEPTPTLAQYQNGDLFWMFTTPPTTPVGNRVELFMLLAAWKVNSLGLLTPDMRNAIRRPYNLAPGTPAAQDAAVRAQLRSSFTHFTHDGYQNLADHLVPLLAIY